MKSWHNVQSHGYLHMSQCELMRASSGDDIQYILQWLQFIFTSQKCPLGKLCNHVNINVLDSIIASIIWKCVHSDFWKPARVCVEETVTHMPWCPASWTQELCRLIDQCIMVRKVFQERHWGIKRKACYVRGAFLSSSYPTTIISKASSGCGEYLPFLC